LGQNFSGSAAPAGSAPRRIEITLPGPCELAQGGTAAGTGINAPVGFAETVADEVAVIKGMPFITAPNTVEVLASHD
ncbi:lyase family protein, partial [Rhizobium johnstonii]|uniref:lyase family protein n=1 Tax=Rhizobium johnstonii TaxID=3019933 RepID=UPI003F9D46A5